MNAIAWLLTIAGAVAFAAAATGVVYVVLKPEGRIISSDTSLPETY